MESMFMCAMNAGCWFPDRAGRSAVLPTAGYQEPGSRLLIGPNYQSITLVDESDVIPPPAAVVFNDSNPASQRYSGVVTITVPQPAVNTTGYAVYFAKQFCPDFCYIQLQVRSHLVTCRRSVAMRLISLLRRLSMNPCPSAPL